MLPDRITYYNGNQYTVSPASLYRGSIFVHTRQGMWNVLTADQNLSAPFGSSSGELADVAPMEYAGAMSALRGGEAPMRFDAYWRDRDMGRLPYGSDPERSAA